MKISQVKSIIQIIITNLQELQTCRGNLTPSNLASEKAKINECKQSLERAFAGLESESIEKLVTKLKQRKRRRSLRRTKRLKIKKTGEKSSSNGQYKFLSNSCISEQQSMPTLKKIQLRTANTYLSIIDCLEILHQLKGGDNSCKLKESLNAIRSVWQSTAKSINRNERNVSSVETQWLHVLFGENPDIEMKYDMKELIERRCNWDSYLVSGDDLAGSYIPIGWVYPKEDARPEWKKYYKL